MSPEQLVCYELACLQAVTGCFMAENPFRLVIGRHLGFLKRALPGTSGRGQKSKKNRPPPLARFVNPQPGPELATRIQDGDLITNSGFFDHPNRLHAG